MFHAATMLELVEQTTGKVGGSTASAPERDLASLVLPLAHHLRAATGGSAEPIAYMPPPGADGAVAFLATSIVAPAAPMNPKLTAAEVADYVDQLRPSLVVVSPERAAELRARLSVPVLTWVDAGSGLGLDAPASTSVGSRERPVPGGVALILPTSGTTGRPKQVPLEHGQLLTSARTIASWLELDETDTSLTMMPLFHIHGLVAGLLAPLVSGGTVAAEPFDAFAFGSHLDRHRPTWFSAVPTMQAMLVERWSSRRDELQVGQLRFVRTSSSALDPGLLSRVEALFGVPAAEAYGMTEASHQMAANPIGPGERRPGTVGVATGVEIAIDRPDEHGRGEVIIRGAQVTRGYRGSPEATADAFTDGWFRTGDEGRLDDGWLTLTGRLKEMINRGGEKVTPLEVEAVIRDFDGVRDCAVFAVPHPKLGEEVGAAIVAAEIDRAALREHLRAQLAPHKLPRHVEVLDALPLGPTGKVQRARLAEQLGL